MSYSQTELDALKSAYAKGVTSVEYDGKKISYASGEDIARRIADIERGINGVPKNMTTIAVFNRGY